MALSKVVIRNQIFGTVTKDLAFQINGEWQSHVERSVLEWAMDTNYLASKGKKEEEEFYSFSLLGLKSQWIFYIIVFKILASN